jgi:alkylation response protein AidB-like acyl-CoA dehydrogenase
MTPVSQLRGLSREHLAWPLFDSRHSEYAALRIYEGATEVQKIMIGRDVLKVA